MKQNLKFMLALGNARLVMVEDEGQNKIYTKTFSTPSNKRANLKRIAFSLASSR